jgi:hypothetical protein
MNTMSDEALDLFFLGVNRLKSRGNVCDMDILIAAHKRFLIGSIKQENADEIGPRRDYEVHWGQTHGQVGMPK